MMKTSNSDNDEDWDDFKVERARQMAQRTLTDLNELRTVVLRQFNETEVDQAMILFGASSFTPKEAFIIRFPAVTKNHSPSNHISSDLTVVNNIMISLSTAQERYAVTADGQRNITKMFVFLNLSSTASANCNQFAIHDDYQLPSSGCKITLFNLINGVTNSTVNCCQNLSIYKDIGNMSISDVIENGATTADVSMDRNSDDFLPNNAAAEDNTGNCLVWFELGVSVEGFKDVLVKGKSIWD